MRRSNIALAAVAIVPAAVPISSLPAVVTPASTDLFIVDQAGTSKQVTLGQVAGGLVAASSLAPSSLRAILGLDTNFRAALLALNPVAYWRHGEAAGTVGRDESGVAHFYSHGVWSSAPTWGAAGAIVGDPNTGVSLVRANSIQMDGGGVVLPAGDRTLLTFLKSAGGTTLDCAMTTSSQEWLSVNGNAAIFHAGGADIYGANVNDGKWHMVVGSITGTTATLYVDGAVSGTPGTISVPGGTANVYVGGLQGSWYYSGSLDESAAFSKGLLVADVLKLWNIAGALL